MCAKISEMPWPWAVSWTAVLCLFLLLSFDNAIAKDEVLATAFGIIIDKSSIAPDPLELEFAKKDLSGDAFRDWQEQTLFDNFRGKVVEAFRAFLLKRENISVSPDEIHEFSSISRRFEEKERSDALAEIKLLEKELSSEALPEALRELKQRRLKSQQLILKSIDDSEKFDRENPKEHRRIEVDIARRFIQSWKINKFLYERYGGRIVFYQGGPEPIDAYYEELKTLASDGELKIHNSLLEQEFWKYYADRSRHIAMPRDDGEKLLKKPWWLELQLHGATAEKRINN